jgi:hypothetical protein
MDNIKTSNVNRFGRFAPAPEYADSYGEFHFRVIDWSQDSDDYLREVVDSEWRCYLDRNSARVEIAERAIAAWSGE